MQSDFDELAKKALVSRYIGELPETTCQRLLLIFGGSFYKLQRALLEIQSQGIDPADYCEQYQLRPSIDHYMDNIEEVVETDHTDLIDQWCSLVKTLEPEYKFALKEKEMDGFQQSIRENHFYLELKDNVLTYTVQAPNGFLSVNQLTVDDLGEALPKTETLASFERIRHLILKIAAKKGDCLQFQIKSEHIYQLYNYLPQLKSALIRNASSFDTVLNCYFPFIQYPNNANRQRWIDDFLGLANQYYLLEEYAKARSIVFKIYCLYEQEERSPPVSIIRLFIKVTLLLGNMAEAALFAVHWRHLLELNISLKNELSVDKIAPSLGDDDRLLSVIENSAIAALIEQQSLCECPFNLALSADDKTKQLLPLIKTLFTTANRLWVLAHPEEDLPLRRHCYEEAIACYEKIKRLVCYLPYEIIKEFKNDVERFLPQLTRSKPLPPPERVKNFYWQPVPLWKKKFASFRASTTISHNPSRDEPCVMQHSVQGITQAMKEIIEQLFASGEMLFGKPPWPYAVMGLGSLAREEACPYSDLEFAIVIQSPSPSETLKSALLAYIKGLLCWMELQLIGLGETQQVVVWRAKKTSEQIKFSIRLGFRFDEGGNVPFSGKGKNFLVGTAEELFASILSPFPGTHIPGDTVVANALQGSAYLVGDETCAANFREKMMDWLQRGQQNQYLALSLLNDHLINKDFNVTIDSSVSSIDIKKAFIRLPVFIAETLALYYGINVTDSIGRLEALVAKQHLRRDLADALLICIDFGLRIRIQAHCFYQEENDEVYFQNDTDDRKKIFLLTESQKNWLKTLCDRVLPPVKQFIRTVFLADFVLVDGKTTVPLNDTANTLFLSIQMRNQDFLSGFVQCFRTIPEVSQPVECLREKALSLCVDREFQKALWHCRFSLALASEENPKYFAYVAQFEQILCKLLQETDKEHYALIVDELLHLPTPEGTRASTYYKARAWKTALTGITDPIPEEGLTNERPPAGRLLLEGLYLGKRLLKSTFNHWFDPQQGGSCDVGYGRHTVYALSFQGMDFHVKKHPEYPGVEAAHNRLLERVTGRNTQETELCRLTYSDGTTHPILIMRTVPGKNIAQSRRQASSQVCHNADSPSLEQQLNQISEEAFSRLFIAALLTTNEDGKPDNLMLHNRLDLEGHPLKDAAGQLMPTLTFIDNERCFLPALVTASGKMELQMKQFIFCMRQMEAPISPLVKTELARLDTYRLLNQWLEALAEENRRCFAVFSQELILRYAHLPSHQSRFPFASSEMPLLPVVLLNDLHERLFYKLNALNTLCEHYPNITHLQLLKRLEPRAADWYARTFPVSNESSTVQADESGTNFWRWEKVSRPYYQCPMQGVEISKTLSASITVKTFMIRDKATLKQCFNSDQGNTYCYLPGKTTPLRLLQSFEIEVICQTLYQGRIGIFLELDCSKKRQVLEQLDFSHLNDTAEKEILFMMQTIRFDRLTIRQAHTLTNEQLRKIVTYSGEQLTSLTLIGCIELTNKAIHYIAEHCVKLEQLQLIGLPRLSKISNARQNRFVFFQSLAFDGLANLIVRDCPRLKRTAIDPLLQKVLSVDLAALSNAVLYARINEVENCLYVCPNLLHQPIDWLDLSGRTFKQLTPFQYALWVCDVQMCELILAKLPFAEAKKQWQELEERVDITSSYGSQMTFDHLIEQCQYYLAHCKHWEYDVCCQQWQDRIAAAQYFMPMWSVYLFTERGKQAIWLTGAYISGNEFLREPNEQSQNWYSQTKLRHGFMRGSNLAAFKDQVCRCKKSLAHDMRMIKAINEVAKSYRQQLQQRFHGMRKAKENKAVLVL